MFVPVYHELVDKMKTSIRSGDLSGRLPGVRVLGKQFGVNPATVSKALRVLEEKGYVSVVPNMGAFVIPRGNTAPNHTIGRDLHPPERGGGRDRVALSQQPLPLFALHRIADCGRDRRRSRSRPDSTRS